MDDDTESTLVVTTLNGGGPPGQREGVAILPNSPCTLVPTITQEKGQSLPFTRPLPQAAAVVALPVADAGGGLRCSVDWVQQ